MKKLLELNAVIAKIKNGERLILAASEELLNQLPTGNWIGGTIPYFMDVDGGVFSRTHIYVDTIPAFAKNTSIKFYSEETIDGIAYDEFENGYTTLIIPAFSALHSSFAKNSIQYPNILHKPLIGWISGIDLADLGKVTPKVFNGVTGEVSDIKAIAMHVELDENKSAVLDIINLFSQGNGDTIRFETTGFKVTECFVNGAKRNFTEYLAENKIDTKLPLVADYCGALFNVSFQNVDIERKEVSFYAPVFDDIEYKIAEPISNYVDEFRKKTASLDLTPVYSCNCILNYLFSELEGKTTGKFTGPFTFGEIAYQLLNQTLVYLTITDQS
ncbi:MAG: hypothetical protein WC209_18720 [Ignavibacteriaceae bacterium]|jgi:hypothetical protein